MAVVPHYRLHELHLRPEGFPQLLSGMGMALMATMTPPGAEGGFAREMQVYVKGASVGVEMGRVEEASGAGGVAQEGEGAGAGGGGGGEVTGGGAGVT